MFRSVSIVLGLAAVVIAGCGQEGSGLVTEEESPSPPPPVALADGTVVRQYWQFRAHCSQPSVAVVWQQDEAERSVAARAEPGHVDYVSLECTIGSLVCFAAWNDSHQWGGGRDKTPTAADCSACSPGWIAVRDLACP